MNKNLNYYYDLLLDMGVSEQALSVGIHFGGYTYDTLCEILYYCFGYQDFDQLEEEEEEL